MRLLRPTTRFLLAASVACLTFPSAHAQQWRLETLPLPPFLNGAVEAAAAELAGYELAEARGNGTLDPRANRPYAEMPEKERRIYQWMARAAIEAILASPSIGFEATSGMPGNQYRVLPSEESPRARDARVVGEYEWILGNVLAKYGLKRLLEESSAGSGRKVPASPNRARISLTVGLDSLAAALRTDYSGGIPSLFGRDLEFREKLTMSVTLRGLAERLCTTGLIFESLPRLR